MINTPQKLTQEQSRKHPTSQEVGEAIQTLQQYLHEDIAEYERLSPQKQVGHIGQALAVLKSLQDFARHSTTDHLRDDLYRSRPTHFHRYSLIYPNFLLSDGVKELASQGDWQWLFNRMADFQSWPCILTHPKRQRSQYWRLVAGTNQSAVLTCEHNAGYREGFELLHGETLSPIQCSRPVLAIWVMLTQFDRSPDVPVYIAYLPEESWS